MIFSLSIQRIAPEKSVKIMSDCSSSKCPPTSSSTATAHTYDVIRYVGSDKTRILTAARVPLIGPQHRPGLHVIGK
jgi:hypothetical protein